MVPELEYTPLIYSTSSLSMPSYSVESISTSPDGVTVYATSPQYDPIPQFKSISNKDDLARNIIKEGMNKFKAPIPKRIIYNGPATIVFWEDGTKTIVKRSKKEKDNKYNAFCAALAKKIYGNNSKVNRYVNSGIEEK